MHNDACEFSPCHEGMKSEDINCLMCFCPAFVSTDCPGVTAGLGKYLDNGVKDCSGCNLPHRAENYKLFSEWNHRDYVDPTTRHLVEDHYYEAGPNLYGLVESNPYTPALWIDCNVFMSRVGNGDINKGFREWVAEIHGANPGKYKITEDIIERAIKFFRLYRFKNPVE